MVVPKEDFFKALDQLRTYHESLLIGFEELSLKQRHSPEVLNEIKNQINVVTTILSNFERCVSLGNLHKKSSTLH